MGHYKRRDDPSNPDDEDEDEAHTSCDTYRQASV
jgi:hypothetical protein